VSGPLGADPAEIAGVLRLLQRTAAEVECQVQGRSMEPAIPHGAAVRIRLDGASGAAPGTAVALLLAGETFTIHRLVHRGASPKASGSILTHGDGNIFCDAPLPDTALLGSVLAVRPEGQPEWQPVPAPTTRPLLRRLLTGAVERMVRLALEIDPRLGGAMKGMIVLLVTPFVWLKPYPAGQTRSTSRLVGPRPVVPD